MFVIMPDVKSLHVYVAYDLLYTFCFLVISYHLISPVTISLGKIICWSLNGGKNPYKSYIFDSKKVAAAA